MLIYTKKIKRVLRYEKRLKKGEERVKIDDISFAHLARAFLLFARFICPSRPFDGVKSVVFPIFSN